MVRANKLIYIELIFIEIGGGRHEDVSVSEVGGGDSQVLCVEIG